MNSTAKRLVVIAALVTLVVAGLLFYKTRTGLRSVVVGKWELDENTFCTALYPNELEFFDDGTYVASGLTIWGGGAYAAVDGDRLRLDTRTGPTAYDVHFNRKHLAFRNSSGCVISFHRAHEPSD